VSAVCDCVHISATVYIRIAVCNALVGREADVKVRVTRGITRDKSGRRISLGRCVDHALKAGARVRNYLSYLRSRKVEEGIYATRHLVMIQPRQ